jgi:hypothetical protein
MRQKWFGYLSMIPMMVIAIILIIPKRAYASGYSDAIGSILVTLLIIVVIFLICREIICWYWKINQSISLLTEIRDLLKSSQIRTNTETIHEKKNEAVIKREKISEHYDKIKEKVVEETVKLLSSVEERRILNSLTGLKYDQIVNMHKNSAQFSEVQLKVFNLFWDNIERFIS